MDHKQPSSNDEYDRGSVQIMTMDHDDDEEPHMYAREGGAEVLRLDGERRSETAELPHPETEQVRIQLQDYDEQQRHLRQIADNGQQALTRPNLRRHDRGAGPYGSFDEEEDEYLSQFSSNGRNSHVSAAMSENKVQNQSSSSNQ